MKGRRLSLQEVLNLEDETKVWVENTDECDEQLGIVHQEGETRVFVDDDCGWFDIKYLLEYNHTHMEYVFFYEWIEDGLIIPDKIETPYYSDSIVNKMSVEICNLRGLDLIDDNIRLIVEEFS